MDSADAVSDVTVVAIRYGSDWSLSLETGPDGPRLLGIAPSLASAARVARTALVRDGYAVGAIRVLTRLDNVGGLDDEAFETLVDSFEAVHAAQHRLDVAIEERNDSIATLREAGLSVLDLAVLSGLTETRIGQIVKQIQGPASLAAARCAGPVQASGLAADSAQPLDDDDWFNIHRLVRRLEHGDALYAAYRDVYATGNGPRLRAGFAALTLDDAISDIRLLRTAAVGAAVRHWRRTRPTRSGEAERDLLDRVLWEFNTHPETLNKAEYAIRQIAETEPLLAMLCWAATTRGVPLRDLDASDKIRGKYRALLQEHALIVLRREIKRRGGAALERAAGR